MQVVRSSLVALRRALCRSLASRTIQGCSSQIAACAFYRSSLLKMATYVGNKFGQADHEKLADYQKRVDPNDKQAQTLLDEMKAHIKKLEEMRKNEDPRLSFSTSEFKEAQRMFTDNLKKNFSKPVEWGMVKDHPWSTPQLRKLDVPVDVDGKPWPLDDQGQPVVKS